MATLRRSAAGAMLIGRERECELLRALAREVTSDRGQIVVVEGPPGIGKSALAQSGVQLFEAAGVSPLRARAAELEVNFAFGVVRQLFLPIVRAAADELLDELFDGAARLAAPLLRETDLVTEPDVDADLSFQRLHGLYWFCANLAERGPLALVVDDAQWCDVASLRFLDFMCRRAFELPIAIVACAREGLDRGPDGEMERLLEHPHAELIRLGALDRESSARLIAADLGAQPSPAFVDACHDVTGGNPLLLREMLREVRAAGLAPDDQGAAEAATIRPTAISRMIQRRLRRLRETARGVAEAVAVLGDDMPAALVTEFAGMPSARTDADVAAAIEELVEAQVLEYDGDSLRYTHPIVRSAVYGDLSPSTRADAHRRAAEFLRPRADAEVLAAHLLASRPIGEPWAVELLRTAAKRAVVLGAPESARGYLRRALEEDPPPELRGALLIELGSAEQPVDPHSAEQRFREALAAAGGIDEYIRAARALALVLVRLPGRAAECHDVLYDALRRLPAEARSLRLEFESQIRTNAHLNGHMGPEELDRLPELVGHTLDPDHAGPDAAPVIACVALERVAAGSMTAEHSVRYARAALASGMLTDHGNLNAPSLYSALQVLLYADALDEAATALDTVLESAQKTGSVVDYGMASWARAGLNRRRGRLHDAEADAISSLTDLLQGGAHTLLARSAATLVEILIERAELERAWSVFDDLGDWNRHPRRSVEHLHHARGSLWLAGGEPAAALEDFLTCGRLISPWEADFPGRLPWRSSAAMALAALDEIDRARELADKELAAARAYGAPRALGIALRAAGAVRPGAAGEALLEEAVATLEPSQARLEYGKALVALAGRIADRDPERARTLLERADDLAARTGSAALATSVAALLPRAGMPAPAAAALHAADALTATERRLAAMATRGRSSKDIAQALFVTERTVQEHVSHAIEKLGVRTLPELATAIADQPTAELALSRDDVREALRDFHQPHDLARSPLAVGAGIEERAASVRRLLSAAAEQAFGQSSREAGLREALEHGYLLPTTSHEAVASQLHLSRATYFRRLRAAAERVADHVLAAARDDTLERLRASDTETLLG